ncbi:ATP-binding protein [Nocardioides sp. LHD-245]|uniref:sensor histidine kinase n=1 Tax=Nocardioides sp. LHD-245 TaxID=3051387 RepID=UPI0027DF203B|nr:ATP-binding protein [Nocardioides sp. LHD-245]
MTAHPGGRRDRRPAQARSRRRVRHGGQARPHSSWWWSAAVTGLLLHPYLVVALLGDGGDARLALAGRSSILLADLLVLGAGIALAVDARLTQDPLRGSMAIAATLVAVQDAPLVVLATVDPALSSHSYRLTTGHLTTVLVVLAVLHRGRRTVTAPQRPIAGGVLLGLGALGMTLGLHALSAALEHGSGFLSTGEPFDVALMILVGVVLAVIGLQLRHSPLPAWASTRIGVGILAIFAARLWATLTAAASPPPLAVAGVAVFSALTATTAAALLRLSLEQTSDRVARYARIAAEAQAEVKQDREVAHDMRSTAAGIAAAARLLASGQVPPGPRRDALEEMVDSETARLGRTVAARPGPLAVVAVDAVVSPLVLAQEALGHRVAWTPGGHRVLARRDALVEVLVTLVTNAADHAGGQGTTVLSAAIGDRVIIVVSDDGPGIDPDIRASLFQWGAHRSRSTGQGIGLHRAHRLILEQGGTLDLVDDAGAARGTVFVITLPRAPSPAADGG